MNIKDPSVLLLYSVSRVYGRNHDGSSVVATGFFYNIPVGEGKGIPLLVTNYHTVENMRQGAFEICVGYPEGFERGPKEGVAVSVRFDGELARSGRLGDLDLVAIPIAQALEDMRLSGTPPFYSVVQDSNIPTPEQVGDLVALEEVTFVGFPRGIFDEANKTGIMRRGITATPIWNDFRGREEFLIDASVFPGSSGSPVFVFNQGSYATPGGIVVGARLFFVGIMAQNMRLEGEGGESLDLGVVVKSSAFKREVDAFVRRIRESEGDA